MTKKESFIKEIEILLLEAHKNLSEDAMDYFNALKSIQEKDKPAVTENGKSILAFIQANNESYNNIFKAKDIGEGMGITSKRASGSMRKLVIDGYLEKIGENPSVYSLTEKGRTFDVEA